MTARLANWFNNHSLRFKLTSLLLLALVAMQLTSGILVTNVVERKLRDDLLVSNRLALEQMAANADEMLMNIVEGLYPVLDTAYSAHLYNAAAPRQEADLAYVTNSLEYQRLFNQLLSSRNNHRFLHSMLVLSEQGDVYTYFANGHYGLTGESLFDKLQTDYGSTGQAYIWSDILEDRYYFAQHREQVVSLIVPLRLYRQVRCYVVLNVSVSRLQAYVADMSGGGSEVLLQTLGGDAIADPGGVEWPAHLGEPLRADIVRDGEHVLLTARLTVNGWPMSLQYSDAASDGFVFLLRTVVPLFVGAGVLMIAGSSLIVGKVTKPLGKLTAIIRTNTTDRKRPQRFKVKYSDEVGLLGDAYNRMMDDLEREQRQSRTAHMKMLQMQIKPHFLYNSMESTRFLVEMGDARAVDMIRAIVTFYKLSLSGADELVPLRREVEHLECYLQILQIRYASRYDYTIQMDEAMLEDEMEKFALQPLVENAIYHGIKRKRGKGEIRIRGYRRENSNVIEVWDNGIGIAPDKLLELRQSLEQVEYMGRTDHIGVLNVHRRLYVRYGPGYGLELESAEGGYTLVRAVIPAIRWRGREEDQIDQADGGG